MNYEFLHGTTASQTARNINSVLSSKVTTHQTVSNWFAKFYTDNFDHKESKVNNDQLKVTIVSDYKF